MNRGVVHRAVEVPGRVEPVRLDRDDGDVGVGRGDSDLVHGSAFFHLFHLLLPGGQVIHDRVPDVLTLEIGPV